MNKGYKVFVMLFLLFQALMILNMFPKKIKIGSYSVEILMEVFFSITKLNNLYNFFTDPANTGNYQYVSNNISMFKGENGEINKIDVSRNGSIKHLVSPVNASRLTHVQSLATNDTLLYNAVVRSQSLFFFKRHQGYPLIYFEVLNHQCKVDTLNRRFFVREKIDTVYFNYFSMN